MERIEHRIEQFLRIGVGDFNSLALELFSEQFEKNALYKAFCQAQGRAPGRLTRWEEIPAVPIRAFQSQILTTFPVPQAGAIFESSATTTGKPGRHYFRNLRLYETALRTSFQQHVLSKSVSGTTEKNNPLPVTVTNNDQVPFFILTPAPGEAPHSSLAWMMEVVRRQWGTGCSEFFVQHDRLNEPRLARALRRTQDSSQPCVLLGTTLAFLAFFEYCARTRQRFALPQGSRLMDTGGMKTSRREVSRDELVDQVQVYLGLTEADCINEYGMCELSSQFYGRGRSMVLQGPPWVRTRIIGLMTGEPVSGDEPGLLCHYDLANVGSVLAIQTEDMGRLMPGERDPGSGFVFLGRAPDAELKGCSLNAESFLR